MNKTTKEVAGPVSITREDLQRAPVAVFGCGVSGQAVMELLNRLGVPYIAYDQREGEGARRSFGRVEAKEHHFAIYSPGFSQAHPWITIARESGCRCIGEMEFASQFWEGDRIAVTGTNGKTTLTEFLTFLLKRQGHDAVAVGNNGYPLSRLLARSGNATVRLVCEVSSFQAESMCNFPIDTLFWTNFSETHLDRYPGTREYFAAKYRLIGLLRKPSLYVGEDVAEAASAFGFELPPFANIIPSNPHLNWELPEHSAYAARQQQRNLKLVCRYWADRGYSEDTLYSAAAHFGIREHRLRRVLVSDGVAYWNDSKSTNFASVLGAIENFNGPVIWIGGGENRGGKIVEFARELANHIRGACLIGETASILGEQLEAQGIPVTICPTVFDAVTSASDLARDGDTVLFSPGFSSHDGFRNYVERGACFENAVFGLKKKIATD